MIPKVLHYCWFGGNSMPKHLQKNIESWKKICPDFELICWNEENFDVHCTEYINRAYQMKKWAFVSDYVRLFVLYNQGGIYLDTDVEIYKPIDKFLDHRLFLGRDRKTKSLEAAEVGTGLIGSEKNHPWLRELLDIYESSQLFAQENKIYLKTINAIMTAHAFVNKGFSEGNFIQKLNDGIVIYPTTYFSPMDYKTRRIYSTENTYAVHKFEGSWGSPRKNSLRRCLKEQFRDTLGEEKYWSLKDNWNKCLGKTEFPNKPIL